MVDSSAQIEYLLSARECLSSIDLESIVNSNTDVTSSAIDQIREDVKDYILKQENLILKIDQAIAEINKATTEVNREIKKASEKKQEEINYREKKHL